jgi:hypothetical protein
MAIYKIFPEKDATIYSEYPTKNTGLDEILEASVYLDTSSNSQRSRFLIKFPSDEISSIFTNYINPGNLTWSASLRCYSAFAEGLNGSSSILVYLVSGLWNMGTGKYNYDPEYQNGVSWNYKFSSGSSPWNTPGGDLASGVIGSQSFSYYNNLDLNINLFGVDSNTLINNDGFIFKQPYEYIDSLNSQVKLQYFSRDTHTIYPPCLELKWYDFTFNTGSLSPLTTPQAVISIDENPGVFYPESINRFRVNARPEYPARVFQTSSYYTQTYYLPTTSYYAVKDLDTNEYIIDFDTQFTQLSCDSNGNYFDLYMNGLEPERYYTILIKTIISGSTIIFNNNYNFKVING